MSERTKARQERNGERVEKVMLSVILLLLYNECDDFQKGRAAREIMFVEKRAGDVVRARA